MSFVSRSSILFSSGQHFLWFSFADDRAIEVLVSLGHGITCDHMTPIYTNGTFKKAVFITVIFFRFLQAILQARNESQPQYVANFLPADISNTESSANIGSN